MNEIILLIIGGKSTALEISEVASSYYAEKYAKIHFLIATQIPQPQGEYYAQLSLLLQLFQSLNQSKMLNQELYRQ